MDATRAFRPFEVVSDYTPSGDQPRALDQLETRLLAGESDVVLLGATGTGKSATTAWLIERLQRPALVLAHNKTLAAQLATELRDMLPHNAVEYFVSYYDYYQPEAYVPQTDTFIEKDSSVNAEVERLRHSTTNSLLSRRDVVVVSTVSCIYGLGAPEDYFEAMVSFQVGQKISREALIKAFVQMQYERNDIAFERGTFRVGETRLRSSRCTRSLLSGSRCLGMNRFFEFSASPHGADLVNGGDDECLPGNPLCGFTGDNEARGRSDSGRARGAGSGA